MEGYLKFVWWGKPCLYKGPDCHFLLPCHPATRLPAACPAMPSAVFALSLHLPLNFLPPPAPAFSTSMSPMPALPQSHITPFPPCIQLQLFFSSPCLAPIQPSQVGAGRTRVKGEDRGGSWGEGSRGWQGKLKEGARGKGGRHRYGMGAEGGREGCRFCHSHPHPVGTPAMCPLPNQTRRHSPGQVVVQL